MGLRSQEQYALLTDYDARVAYSQAFYTLFANLRFHWENAQADVSQATPASSQVHTLLVAAASPYNDQATIAANLAIVAAQSGAETILVDADLRAPGIRQRFGLAQTAGLGDLLEAEAFPAQTLESYLQSTFVPGLRVLGTGTTGLTRSTALLLSSRLEQVATGLRSVLLASKKSSSVVIFHCASVSSGVDASLIGTLTEQTVLTILMGKTTRAQAKQAQEQLQQAHVALAGVVMLHP